MKSSTVLKKGFLRQNLTRMMSNAVHVRSTAASGSQVYESKRAVDEYLLFHFGKHENVMPYPFGPKESLDFPQRCAEMCGNVATKKENSRALDVGCSVGGSAFHLAKHFDEVVGIDFSDHFIAAANVMKEASRMDYDMLQQGDIFSRCSAAVPADIDRSRVHFAQGDACNLSADLG